MSQRILSVRVRPARVTVLIDRGADEKNLLLVLEFFSRIWAGRFCQILAVDPKSIDPLTKFRLSESRPEFVYGLGIDDAHWSGAVHQACQPRGYSSLRPDFVRDLRYAVEGYILVDHAPINLFQTRGLPTNRKRLLKLVSSDEQTPSAAFCAAMFGAHHANLRREYYDELTTFASNSTLTFIDLATEFVKNWQQSWLDITGHKLNPHVSGLLPPTIVLVGSVVSDLSLFWNLRSASDTIYPAGIMPIPVNGAADPIVLEKMKDWLLAFLPYGSRPDYCVVTSQTVEERVCQNFAEHFQVARRNTDWDCGLRTTQEPLALGHSV